MKVAFEQKKVEVTERMRMFHLHPDIIKLFERQSEIIRFEPPFGSMNKVDDDELGKVRQLENEYGLVVYAIVRGKFAMEALDTFLFVNDTEEEWETDRQQILNAARTGVFAYVYNRAEPERSEFTFVGIDCSMFGGLRRTW